MSMEYEDSKLMRRVPGVYTEGEYAKPISKLLSAGFVWESLANALDAHAPRGLGIVLPFSWQMHFYAYKEASKRNIVTAVAMPSNVSALSGLMKSVPIDAVVTTHEGAEALVKDLSQMQMLQEINLWVVVSTKENKSSFAAPVGTTVHHTLP